MRKWLTGLEVIEKLGIKDFELFDFVKEGLPPYTHAREKLPPPNVYLIMRSLAEAEDKKKSLESYRPKSDEEIKNYFEAAKKNPAILAEQFDPYIKNMKREYENFKKEIQTRKAELEGIKNPYSWEDYKLPSKQEDIKRIYHSLLNSLYRVEDVEATNHAPQIESVIQEANAPAPARAGNFFTREGAIWHIGFEGQKAPIQHLTGLQYIGYLLDEYARRKTSISCKELYQAASGKTRDKIMSEGAAIGEGFNIGSRKQAASDYKARQNYEKKYRELQNDLDNAESEMERQEIEKEMEAIMPFLKERTFTDKNTTRFQSNVRRGLDKAYAAIRKAGMKEMEKHLRDHIKADGAYGLTYTGAAAWEITIK